MEVSIWNKIKKCSLYFLAYILFCLFDGYRWRGFLSRVVVAILLYKFGKAGSPEHYATGPASGKLILAAYAILIYSIYKLIFDYTKRGVELERKRRIESESHEDSRGNTKNIDKQ